MLANFYKWSRSKLKIKINDTEVESLVDTIADVTIIPQTSRHPNWPLQESNVQRLGIGNLSQVKQSARRVKCIRPKGQIGKLKLYVSNIMRMWFIKAMGNRD